jgi:hypothetical protein
LYSIGETDLINLVKNNNENLRVEVILSFFSSSKHGQGLHEAQTSPRVEDRHTFKQRRKWAHHSAELGDDGLCNRHYDDAVHDTCSFTCAVDSLYQ